MSVTDDDAVSIRNESRKTLPYLLSSLFATILEDTITELLILEQCNNELKTIKCDFDWTYLLSLKYEIKQPEFVDELDGVDPHNLGLDKHKINKLDFDRKYVRTLMNAIYVDLSLHKSFKPLEDIVRIRNERDEYRRFIVEDEARNKMSRKDINRQLRLQRNHIKRVLYDTDATIDDLKTQVEDSTLYSECKSRYIDNWQRARTEQHIQTIHDSENTYKETIEYYKQRIDHEQRVHAEIELLVNIIISEKLELVEEWMNKYDKDMEKIDLKIQIKKNEYQDMLSRRLGLEKTIADHEQLMKNWVDFKDAREKARLYREKMTKAALCVQAWWRGLLVRKQLGPYKVSKKKGAAAGKKK